MIFLHSSWIWRNLSKKFNNSHSDKNCHTQTTKTLIKCRFLRRGCYITCNLAKNVATSLKCIKNVQIIATSLCVILWWRNWWWSQIFPAYWVHFRISYSALSYLNRLNLDKIKICLQWFKLILLYLYPNRNIWYTHNEWYLHWI